VATAAWCETQSDDGIRTLSDHCDKACPRLNVLDASLSVLVEAPLGGHCNSRSGNS
jgi:hypothetical protein